MLLITSMDYIQYLHDMSLSELSRPNYTVAILAFFSVLNVATSFQSQDFFLSFSFHRVSSNTLRMPLFHYSGFIHRSSPWKTEILGTILQFSNSLIILYLFFDQHSSLSEIILFNHLYFILTHPTPQTRKYRPRTGTLLHSILNTACFCIH